MLFPYLHKVPDDPLFLSFWQQKINHKPHFRTGGIFDCSTLSKTKQNGQCRNLPVDMTRCRTKCPAWVYQYISNWHVPGGVTWKHSLLSEDPRIITQKLHLLIFYSYLLLVWYFLKHKPMLYLCYHYQYLDTFHDHY